MKGSRGVFRLVAALVEKFVQKDRSAMSKLTAQLVRGLRSPGRYSDGQGLSLDVRSAEQRYWMYRYMRDGRERYMSLGSANALSLADARKKHAEVRALLAKGIDPMESRSAQKVERKASTAHRFGDVIEQYIAAHRSAWRGRRSEQHWRRSLAMHALPLIGDKPVSRIDLDDVLRCLQPIWQAKPVMAGLVRGRLELVLDYANARGWRTGENPARWRGNLKMLLPAHRKVHRVVHRAALPWTEVSDFMHRLLAHADAGDGTSALALAFVVLTACRSGEVRGARWDEINMDAALWTIPGVRMKSGKEHRVPLSPLAMDILRRLAFARSTDDPLVFFGQRPGRVFKDTTLKRVLTKLGHGDFTVHGFRSTFRDWAAETTGHANHVVEQALAHIVSNAVEAAYRRGDLLEKRRVLMADWAAYLGRAPAEVIPLRASAAGT